jgi:hypothetical protein
MLIGVTIPENGNVIKKEAEKILEYADLIKEIQCMWNVNAKVIPEITGNWNHFTITQTITEQHTRKAGN